MKTKITLSLATVAILVQPAIADDNAEKYQEVIVTANRVEQTLFETLPTAVLLPLKILKGGSLRIYLLCLAESAG